MLSYLQATVIGLLQGVTELFPVSSLGHSVLVPALFGGSWRRLVSNESAAESPYLAFVVGLHVATAIALVIFFRRDWARILRGLYGMLRTRRVETADARLGGLIVLATIPVGIVGLAFEHQLRTLFAKPLAAALFLTANGVLLLVGERLRRRAVARTTPAPRAAVDAALTYAPASGATPMSGDGRPALAPAPVGAPASAVDPDVAADARLAGLPTRDAVGIGAFQILALFAGISRSGATMVGGLWRGLSHEDAARFSFLLATPVILAAGVVKLPDLFGPLGNGIRGQVLVGSVVAGLAAYASVRFLTRWFSTRTLTPFAVYCLLAGGAAALWFGVGPGA